MTITLFPGKQSFINEAFHQIQKNTSHHLVIIDSKVKSSKLLEENTLPDTSVEIIKDELDGVAQITKVLQCHPGAKSLHIVSHGAPGKVFIGKSELSSETLELYSSQLKDWTYWLAPNAELLIYGCEVAKNEQGRSFITQLSTLINVVIIASETRTGNEALGGNWNLEYSTGQAKTPCFLSCWGQTIYQDILATYEVSNTNLTGLGSFANAIVQANMNPGPDSITFILPANSIVSVQATFTDSAETSIDGSSVSGLTITQPSVGLPPINISANATVKLNALTISGNTNFIGGFGPPAQGAAIYNDGNLTVSNSTISGNKITVDPLIGTPSASGGAIYNDTNGNLAINNTSILNNSVQGSGGGIANAGILTISSSTISGNSASGGGFSNGSGGGIDNFGTLNINNSIVSGNSATVGSEIYSTNPVESNNYNLFGFFRNSGLNGVTTNITDVIPNVPLNQILAPSPANNGGPTQTLALVEGSPAINAGDPAYSNTIKLDQRGLGFNRIRGNRIDIGAFETQPNSPVALSEKSSDGTIVETIADIDPNAVFSTYAITSGNSDFNGNGKFAFTINSNTGVITVNDSSDLNFQVIPKINLKITATTSNHLSQIFDITINLFNVNDAPIGKDSTVNVQQNSTYIFNPTDFSFSDPNDSPPNNLLAVKIDSLPTQGNLIYNGRAVSVGQSISTLDITSGLLQFTPISNSNGLSYTSFNFQVQDDGGTLLGGIDLDQTPKTMTINVNSFLTLGSGIDPTFGVGGTVITDFFGPYDTDSNVAVQSDGKILVIGYSHDNSDFLLSRFNSNGSIDNTFGINGEVTTDFGGTDNSNSVTVQSDGKIVVAGFTDNSDGTSSDYFAISRYYSNGSLDTSFGTNGKVTTKFDGSFNVAHSVKQQRDGKLVVAGTTLNSSSGTSYNFALSRYNLDGSLDTTFGSNGEVVTDFYGSDDSANSIVLQNDGKIVVVGSTFTGSGDFTSATNGYDFAISRYNIDGSLDTTFGTNGKVTTDFGSNDGAKSVVLQADGKIVVAGSKGFYSNSNADFAVSRYNSDGSLDKSFGINGEVVTDFNGSTDIGQSVLIESDGKIIVAGVTQAITSNPKFALVRYNVDGSLDTTFGNNGKIISTIDGSAPGAALQPDGNIIIAGNSDSSVAISRYLSNYVNTDNVNNAPIGEDKTVTTVSNTTYTFKVDDFKFTDPNDVPSNNLQAIKIDALPVNGTLTNGGNIVTVGEFISTADLAAGNLKFIPAIDSNGPSSANFTFQIQDDGGTANGGVDLAQSLNTFTIDISSSGSSTGDPHIKTFDGLSYDFQAQGDFTLVKATDSELNVQVRQSAWSANPSTTLNTALATEVDGKQLEFYTDQPLPILDDIPLNLDVGQTLTLDNGSISRTHIQGYNTQGDLYTVSYSNGDQLRVNVFPNFLIDPTVLLSKSHNVNGLLGNDNGKSDDDLTLREGTVPSAPMSSNYLLTDFAKNWQVNPEDSLFSASQLPNSSNLVMGTAGNNILTGNMDNDILVGCNWNQLNPGSGEVDRLVGGVGSDTFILGDKNNVFYSGDGMQDYAIIQNFSSQKGDLIQLKGHPNDYMLGAVSTNQLWGTGIFLLSKPNELIGLIEDVHPKQLSLSQSAFHYV